MNIEEYREARKKYLANLSPEEREELERKKQEAEIESKKRREDFFEQNKELIKWLEDEKKANAHHEKAIKVLLDSLRSTANHQDMTPKIKESVEALIFIIEDRSLFEYELEAIMRPLIKIVEKDTQSKSGSNAAIIRHAKNKKDKDAREKKIKGIWAEGNFSDRDTCAEQEYSAAGFSSFGSARKALRNTPDPFPWPAKNK